MSDDSLSQLLTRIIADATAALSKLGGATATAGAAHGARRKGGIADDNELDSPWGDEVVKFNPRDWRGEPIKGCKMSQCNPDALEKLADACEYFAVKNEGQLTEKGKPKSDFDLRTAARARGWARRLRESPAAEPSNQTNVVDPFHCNENEIPF